MIEHVWSDSLLNHEDRIAQWRLIRDCIDGEDAIKARGELYLPLPSGMNLKTNPLGELLWQNYIGRASFYGVAERTLQMLAGMVMRISPIVSVPSQLEPMLDEDATTGLGKFALAEELVSELMSVGRVGFLVDMPRVGGNPYVVEYKAENIDEWTEAIIDGRRVPTRVRLREDVSNDVTEGWVETDRYRVLELVEGKYTVTIEHHLAESEAKAGGQAKTRVDEEQVVPKFRGKPLDFIPFAFAPSVRMAKPPMLDLCRMGVAHYRNSADYEWTLFMTSQPTPYATGIDAEDREKIKGIGPGVFWIAGSPESRFGMLEFQGIGAAAIRAAMLDKESRMAVLGADLISDNVNRNERAETARMRNRVRTSALLHAVSRTEAAMRQIYQFAARMLGADPNGVLVQLNRDFMEAPMTGGELVRFVQAHQQGGIDDETFVDALKEGELVKPDRTTEEVIGAILANRERALAFMAKQAQLTTPKQPGEGFGRGDGTSNPPRMERSDGDEEETRPEAA